MKEEKIQVFIDGVNRYFNEVYEFGVDVGTPYLVSNNHPRSEDYTGIIGISGDDYRGCVYFTASESLLKKLLVLMEENSRSEDNKRDLVGEIANTISGNARSEFGESFMISVPVVVSGVLDNIHLPKNTHSYVIPITYKNHEAAIVVSLQEL
ncbi:MAG: chemotaxis protein CheX [Gammaproteobacteria bacterium]|nr:MAG: chemotaxis protein CheX [Gammaproteobacteria bacterium]